MRKAVSRIARVAVIAMALPLMIASQAPADDYREFAGKVDKIGTKKMLVDNRKGDKVSFFKTDATEVSGEKSKWKDIKKNDWVAVSWKMMDKPRVAYKVVVMPPKKEAGVDE